MTNDNSSNIERASMDGTTRTVIHSGFWTTLFGIADIVLDYSTQTLYWANVSHHIGSSNADGSNKRLLTLNVSYVHTVNFFEGNLYYYTPYYWGRIASASTIMMPNADQFRYDLVRFYGYIRDIKVISDARQTAGIITIIAIVDLILCYNILYPIAI